MSPQRWREIEDLFHAALEREPGARAALLEEADPELRSEVESLLAQTGSLPNVQSTATMSELLTGTIYSMALTAGERLSGASPNSTFWKPRF